MSRQIRKNCTVYRLEPTAAVVMVWARKLYNKGLPKRYLEMLDFSSAKKILQQEDKICSWYGEVILNRKYLIRYLAEQRLKAAKVPYQVIILASGKSPLTLELLSRYGSKLEQVIEVDTAGLLAKKRIFQHIAPEICKKIKFVSADVISKEALNAYNACGGTPSIIIFEGFSYYIPTRKLKKIIRVFRSRHKHNLLIIEYLVPYSCVAKERRHIPRENFAVARHVGGLRELTHYTSAKLKRVLHESDGSPKERFTLKDMEFLRTGKNHYFKHDNEGWIECIAAHI